MQSGLEDQPITCTLAKTCMARVYPKSKQIKYSFWMEVKSFGNHFSEIKKSNIFSQSFIIISNLTSETLIAIMKDSEYSKSSKADKAIKARWNFWEAFQHWGTYTLFWIRPLFVKQNDRAATSPKEGNSESPPKGHALLRNQLSGVCQSLTESTLSHRRTGSGPSDLQKPSQLYWVSYRSRMAASSKQEPPSLLEVRS